MIRSRAPLGQVWRLQSRTEWVSKIRNSQNCEITLYSTKPRDILIDDRLSIAGQKFDLILIFVVHVFYEFLGFL
jgi:hypothetical protein